jgi:hypothetical protein
MPLPDPYDALPSLSVLAGELTVDRTKGSLLHAARPRSASKDIAA